MRIIFVASLCLLLTACAASAPSSSDIREGYAQSLPGLLALQDFKIENQRNVGSKEQPVWLARLVSTVATREPTYDIQTVVDGVRILKPVRSAGERFNVYGTVRSERDGDHWRHRFENDGSSNPVLGRPRADYGPDALVTDSPEAKALLDRVAQEKEQARIAEETRIAAEAAERKRNEEAEAANRQRIEAAAAKYQAGFAPVSMWDYVSDGQTRRVLVTASLAKATRSGVVYGTDRYGSHSDFARSVIHAGLLKDGETGVVEVTGFDEWKRSQGSPRNGIDSEDTDSRNIGYTMRLVERIPIL